MNPSERTALVEQLKALRARREQRKDAERAGKRRRHALSRSERAEVFAKSGGRCHMCGGVIEADAWEADHVLAHSGGGAHATSNYLASHRLCNNYRWDYLPEEFQIILKLGVWARTRVETETAIGVAIAEEFVAHERRRVARRRGARAK